MLLTFIVPVLLYRLAVLPFLELRSVAVLCVLLTFTASVLLGWLGLLGLIPWISSGVESLSHVSEATLSHLTFLILSFLAILSISFLELRSVAVLRVLSTLIASVLLD
jgi:hypothetical protein